MKTKNALLGLAIALMSLGMGSSAWASANKYADYRAQVEATKTVVSSGMNNTLARGQNKYVRTDLVGTLLAGLRSATGPKNYRNNMTRS